MVMSSNKFTEQILKIYKQNNFGHVLKSDIDIIVFDFIVSEILKDKTNLFLSDNSINYMSLSHHEIYLLSRELKISEMKIKNYIYLASLNFQSQNSIEETFTSILKNNITKFILPKEKLNNGLVKIYVPNKLFKQEIEIRLSKIGGLPDYSFNRDILSLEIIDFIFLLKSQFSEEEMKNLCIGLIQKSKISEKDDSYTNFIKEINKKQPREIFEIFLKDLGKKVIGKSSDIILNYIFDFIKK